MLASPSEDIVQTRWNVIRVLAGERPARLYTSANKQRVVKYAEKAAYRFPGATIYIQRVECECMIYKGAHGPVQVGICTY